MRFSHPAPTSAALNPGDRVWKAGESIVIETVELVPATQHRLAEWLINGTLRVSEGHTWTREET